MTWPCYLNLWRNPPSKAQREHMAATLDHTGGNLQEETGARGEALLTLQSGMLIPFSGDRFTRVSEDLARAFAPGDQLVVVQDTGDLLHIPAGVQALARH